MIADKHTRTHARTHTHRQIDTFITVLRSAIDRGLNKKRRTPRSISNEPLTLWGRSSDVGVDGLCWWQAESEGHGADADTSESSEPTTGVSESTCLAALTQTRH